MRHVVQFQYQAQVVSYGERRNQVECLVDKSELMHYAG